MTATRSLTFFTTARSWAMKTMVRPNFSFRSARRLRIWACTDTSSAETGSSQISRSGSAISARAMLIRWHWPPENSWGRRSPAASGSMPTASSMLRTRSARSSRVPRFQIAQRLGDDVLHPAPRVQ